MKRLKWINGLLTIKIRLFFIVQMIIMTTITWLIVYEMIQVYHLYYYMDEKELDDGYYVCDIVDTDNCSTLNDVAREYEKIHNIDGVKKLLYSLKVFATVTMNDGVVYNEMVIDVHSRDSINCATYEMLEGKWFGDENSNQVVLGSGWKAYCDIGDEIILTLSNDCIEKYEVIGFLKYNTVLGYGYSHNPDWNCVENVGEFLIVIDEREKFTKEWADICEFYNGNNAIVIADEKCELIQQCKEREFVCTVDQINKNTDEIYKKVLLERLPYLFVFFVVVVFGMIGANYAVIPKYLSSMYVYYISGMSQMRYKKMLINQYVYDAIIIFVFHIVISNFVFICDKDVLLENIIICLSFIAVNGIIFLKQIGKIINTHPMEVYRRYIEK